MADLVCWDDLDPNAAEMNDPLAELLQDLYHRLIETPGSNIDDPDRGLGLISMLSGPIDRSLASKIDAEFRKDDRVDHADTLVTQTSPDVYTIAITISPQGSLVLEANTKANTVTRVT